MATTTRQELLDLNEPERGDRWAGVGRRRFLAGLGASAVALAAGDALGQGKGGRATEHGDQPAA